MKLLERLEVICLPLEDVLGGDISEAEQQALFTVEHDILPAHVHPLLACGGRLNQAITIDNITCLIYRLFVYLLDIVEVIFAIDDPSIIPAQLIIRERCNLVKCAHLTGHHESLCVEGGLDIVTIYDALHRFVLKLNIILYLYLLGLLTFLILDWHFKLERIIIFILDLI